MHPDYTTIRVWPDYTVQFDLSEPPHSWKSDDYREVDIHNSGLDEVHSIWLDAHIKLVVNGASDEQLNEHRDMLNHPYYVDEAGYAAYIDSLCDGSNA